MQIAPCSPAWSTFITRSPRVSPLWRRATSTVRSPRRSDDFATDQHPTDLVRARADVEQLGVAREAFDRPLLGIARATQRLDRLQADLHRILARQQDRAGRIETSRLATVARLSDGID